MLRNDFPFLEVTFAVGRLGAHAVPINWHFVADEVEHILQDSGSQGDRRPRRPPAADRGGDSGAGGGARGRDAGRDRCGVQGEREPRRACPRVESTTTMALEPRRVDRGAAQLAGRDALHLRHHRQAQGRAPQAAEARADAARSEDRRADLRLRSPGAGRDDRADVPHRTEYLRARDRRARRSAGPAAEVRSAGAPCS